MIFSSMFWAGRRFTFTAGKEQPCIAQITWIRCRTGHDKIHGGTTQLLVTQGHSVPKIWLPDVHTANFQLREKKTWTKSALPPTKYLTQIRATTASPLLRTPFLSCFLTASSSKTLPLNTTALQTHISLTSSMRHLCSYNII